MNIAQKQQNSLSCHIQSNIETITKANINSTQKDKSKKQTNISHPPRKKTLTKKKQFLKMVTQIL